MKTHEFTVVATGLDLSAPGFADRFFEAGCDDATISYQRGAIMLHFHREARSFGHALRSALADVEAAGAEAVHVEPDDLVSISDIAGRAGVTRAAASLYATGRRGTSFPSPVARLTTESPLWDWVDVARWLYRQGRLPMRNLLDARIVRRTNFEMARRRDGAFGAHRGNPQTVAQRNVA